MLINKIEFENLFDHFGRGGEGAVVDMDAFLVAMRQTVGGEDPVRRETHPPPSAYTSAPRSAASRTSSLASRPSRSPSTGVSIRRTRR